MRRTLLDLTQNILSSLNSDEVNSISDTTESQQVAEIIKTTYYNMMSRYDLPENNQFYQLVASGSITKPVLMTRPDHTARLEWLKYFDSTADVEAYKEVRFLPLKEFIDMMNTMNVDDDNVDSFSLAITNEATADAYTFTFLYKNDTPPRFYTVVERNYVIFDAYDSAVDTTLQSAKTMAYGRIFPSWTNDDSFVPVLNDQQVPLLLNEAKSLAFLELKQQGHPKAEKEVQRLTSSLQKKKDLEDPPYFRLQANFGRK